jgi:dihydroorotate dehydrogenase
MLAAVFELARPLLYALDPEQAHELTLKSLEAGIYPRPSGPDDNRLALSVWGLTFPNPLGIAAGFDKNARVSHAMLGMGSATSRSARSRLARRRAIPAPAFSG